MANEDGPKGAYNRARVFKSENYVYWKQNMYVNLLPFNKNLWVAIT